MAQVRKILGPKAIVRLRQYGFTVTNTSSAPGSDTITASGVQVRGGLDGQLAKFIRGKGNVVRLRKMGMWT